MDGNASLNGRPSKTALGNIQMTFVATWSVKNRTNRGTWNSARAALVDQALPGDAACSVRASWPMISTSPKATADSIARKSTA